jgi:probable HAF family extracellular repeat protein
LKTFAVVIVFLVCSAIAPRSQDGVFFMALPAETLPSAVGANAFSIVGSFYEGGALLWKPTSGTVAIGARAASGVSRDGKVVVGDALDPSLSENAAIWQGGDDWRVLGSIRPGAQSCDRLLSSAFGTSADGNVIVGLAWDGCRIARAFRWEESTGMVDLGTSNARSTRANAVSGDGRVVIGWQESEVGVRQGAKWINNQQEIIRNSAGRVVGEARASNMDGSIIVGQNCDLFNPNPVHPEANSAWKWTSQGGARCSVVTRPPTLPNLPYITMMLSTSDDGRVIGGSYSFGLDAESVIWINDQPQFLRDFLRDNGLPDAFRGWVNTGFITGVSPDGRTLVGYGAGPRAFQGFLVILPG